MGTHLKLINKFRGKFFFLSNFSESPMEYNGEFYPTAEHAFQAAKATNKYDKDKVKAANTPKEAKKNGKKIKLREDWQEVKDQVMEDILKTKFSNIILAQKLTNTHPAELVEGNEWGDMYWGICAGVGKNKLGKLLMKVRKEIITRFGEALYHLEID